MRPEAVIASLAFMAAAACSAPVSEWAYDPSNNDPGRIYYYERTNSDGSDSERITVFLKDAVNLEVYKEKSLCTNAALVSAEMDWATFSAARITGGRLLPDAEHEDFAFLDWDKSNDRLSVTVRFPDGEFKDDAPVESVPWHIFDFDLASLTVATPHLRAPEKGFSFGMALIWTDPSESDPLSWIGAVNAVYAGEETRLGTRTRKFDLTGSALTGPRSTGGEGALWLDAAQGHIVDAVLPVPNHDGYKDFRLRLIKVSDGGAEEWESLLRAHFEGC